MTSLELFPWPIPPQASVPPQWNGRHFDTGGQISRVLVYGNESSHWSDDLTILHETEAGQNHPIDVASRRLAAASMQRLSTRTPIILDVGCSSGFVLEKLRQLLPQAELIGADYLQGPLTGLAQRMIDIPLLQFDLRHCPLPEGCVDGVTCLNVLEHIDDHEAALAGIYRILKPGGIAHIEVPAGPSLYDIYDKHLMHHRRYTMAALSALARKTGFQIEQATHLGFFVFPAFWWVKKRNRRLLSPTSEQSQRLVARQIHATKVNPLFAALIAFETLVGSLFSYPLGIRCVCRLRKS